ncbi:hypothetical protein ACVWW6_000019 [Bradyrhizobium sp. USDA 3311]
MAAKKIAIVGQGLFGSARIAGRGWKTDDLRSQTIRRALTAAHCSTRADEGMTLHELLEDQRHTSVPPAILCSYSTIADRLTSLRSDLSVVFDLGIAARDRRFLRKGLTNQPAWFLKLSALKCQIAGNALISAVSD